MKKIAGICILAASVLAAHLSPAQAASPDVAAGAARWSASAMDRHLPLAAAPAQPSGARKFRYMDMAQTRRSPALHNAVLVVGPARPAKAGEQAVPRSPLHRNHTRQAGARVIMRPMT
ncbi:hypothetical protein [Herbaspirillum sp. NPDC087042]|uniref:hypothetical protein n=1 Tax=Herbaspirillum sp. NPDC087042 TaxID=3364004 RepID=UPI00381BF5D5